MSPLALPLSPDRDLLPLTLPGLWHDLVIRGAAVTSQSQLLEPVNTVYITVVFSSHLIFGWSCALPPPCPLRPPPLCSMDYPPTAPMSTEVCPRLPHSGMISQETTSRCYALYTEGEKRWYSYRNGWPGISGLSVPKRKDKNAKSI